MHRIVAALAIVLATSGPAFATWSVIALDQKTGAVAVGSAACLAQRSFVDLKAKGLMDLQAIVVPGKAVAVAQAGIADGIRTNQRLIYTELARGTDPDALLYMLLQDASIESRQFAILDMEGRQAAFSGSATPAVSLHQQGQVPGTDIRYSVQGDYLPSADALQAAVQALTMYSGALADRVMAAMEAADAYGGDRRCSCESQPTVKACETKTAHVAYLLLAQKSDRNKESYNDGQYAMYISVTDDDIKPAEDANPVKTLRLRYEAWKRARPN